MNIEQVPWIKLEEYLNQEDYALISELQEVCIGIDKIALKLELDYKLGAAVAFAGKNDLKEINEFMYFIGQQLVGYIGICGSGGFGMPLEITGMVHPQYRRQGIFSRLSELVFKECKRRNSGSLLLLCDNKSDTGKCFLKKIGAIYKYSEFEMYLKENLPEPEEKRFCGVTLRKADNTDAYEIARQNAVYFGDETSDFETIFGQSNSNFQDDNPNEGILLPEEEEKRGLTIYLAEKENQIIGKVHLQVTSVIGGIYGLGIMPEYRGRGFGRALLLSAVKKLKEADIKNIMLQVAAENATALSLYKSCGFDETSTMDYYELIP